MSNLNFKLRLPTKGAYYIVLLSFIITLTAPFISPIFPLFIRSLVFNDAYVGYVVSITAMLLLISAFIVGKILQYVSRVKLLRVASLGYGISFFVLAFVKTLPQFIFVEIFRAFFTSSIFICLGLLLKDLSKTEELGKVEGWNFTIANIAWFISPLLGGFIAFNYSNKIVFMLAAIFPLLVFIITSLNPIKIKEYKSIHHNHTFNNLKNFFSNHNLRILYLASMGIIFWWVLFYTFLPLYMNDNGLSKSQIGIVLALVTIPLILLEIPAGKLADKFGYRKFLFLGFIILSIAGLFASFSGVNLSIIFIIMGSFGAAFLEPLREAFFLKSVSDEDEIDFYPIYKTALEVGRLLGLFVFSTILLYFRYNILLLFASFILLIFGLLMLLLRAK